MHIPVGSRSPKLGGEDHVRIEDLLQALPDGAQPHADSGVAFVGQAELEILVHDEEVLDQSGAVRVPPRRRVLWMGWLQV